MSEMGVIKKVDIRSVLRSEALDFTPWLANNIDLLSEVVGFEIIEPEKEVSVGAFKIDILAKDSNGNSVVIENQYGKTDHDHLGKLLAYSSGKNAKTTIWIVEEAREEHRAAIEWLNEYTTEEINLFLVKIEFIKIDNSPPAPRFEIISSPNNWLKTMKNVGSSSTDSALKLLQQSFFEELVTVGKMKSSKVKSWQTPRTQHWFDISNRTRNTHITVTVNSIKKYVGVELYIKNKEIFYKLKQKKEEFEKIFGNLEWNEAEKHSRILKTIPFDIKDAKQDREQIYSKTIALIDKFFEVFVPVVKKIEKKGKN